MRDFLIFVANLKKYIMWIVILIVVFIVGVFFLAKDHEKIDLVFKKENNVSVRDLLPAGTYVSGHPLLNESFKGATLLLGENEVKIFTAFAERAIILKESITNVAMEDSSTIQNRVTVGRLLLTGIFAFAWKKKTKQECAYFIIEWKQGQFNNETIFEFEGKGSIQKANTLRNKFTTYLSTSSKDKLDEELRELIKAGAKYAAINIYAKKKGVSDSEAIKYVDGL